MIYKIYQLKREHSDLLFRSYNENKFDINNYNIVYVGDTEFSSNIVNDLDNIYRMLNINRPENFKGHSLSVSDLIEYRGALYFVERMGFKKIEKNI